MSEILYLYSVFCLQTSETDDDTLNVFVMAAIRLWFFGKMKINFLLDILKFAQFKHLFYVFYSFQTGYVDIAPSNEWTSARIGNLFRGIEQKKKWAKIGEELHHSKASVKTFYYRLLDKIENFCKSVNFNDFNCSDSNTPITITIRSKNSVYNEEEKSNLVKDPTNLISKLSHFRSKIANQSKIIKILQQKLRLCQDKIVDYEVQLLLPTHFKEILSNAFSPMSEKIISTSLANAGKRNHSIYDEASKVFWIEKYSRGIDLFFQLTNILHGPALSTVQNWIKYYNCPKHSDLNDITKTESIIHYYLEKLKPQSDNCILAIDAIKLDEDLTICADGDTVKGIMNQNIEKPPLLQFASDPQVFQQIIDYYHKKNKLFQMSIFFTLRVWIRPNVSQYIMNILIKVLEIKK